MAATSDDEHLQQEEHEEEQQQQQQQQQLIDGHEDQDADMDGDEEEPQKELPPMVETIQRGMDAMSSKRDELNDQIDALTESCVKFMDDLKQEFLLQMNRLREDISQSCTHQEAEWRELSDTTMQCQRRLTHAQHFVRQLGMSVENPADDGEEV